MQCLELVNAYSTTFELFTLYQYNPGNGTEYDNLVKRFSVFPNNYSVDMVEMCNAVFSAHYLFAGTGGPSKGSPRMSDLANRVAVVIPDKWKMVAVQLELARGEIKIIQKDEGEIVDRFMAVMDKWEQSIRKPFTWATLVTALQSPSVNETRLADELYREFC